MQSHTFENESAWLEALTTRWQEATGQAVHARGAFKVCLAGGMTPEPFYRRLATLDSYPWSAARFFIGDERCVSPEHAKSNYRMIHRAFYPHKIRIERWATEISPDRAADDYQRRMLTELGNPPKFDLALLGIGDDGHTAALFPNTAALAEEKNYTAANRIPPSGEIRLTLTYPAFQRAREVWFLARGPQKQPWIEKMENESNSSFPAAEVKRHNGNIHLFYFAG